MASRTSEAKARVALDAKQFEEGSKAVINAANAMSAAVTAAFAAAGVAVLATFGAKTISGLVDTLKEVIHFGEEMANAGHKAGIAAGQFYLFNAAVEKGLTMRTVAGLIGENAEVLNRSANIFRDVAIKLWAVGEKIRGFWLGLMERVAPVLSRLLDGALAFELVSAGHKFGDAIAEALAVIYQMVQDGTIWRALKDGFTLAFEYAGERMIWFGGIGYDILQQAFSQAGNDGFDQWMNDVKPKMADFCSHIAELLANSFFKFWINVKMVVYDLLDKMDSMLASSHIISEETRNKSVRHRARDIADMNQVAGGASQFDNTKEGTSFGDRINSILDKNKFSPTATLTQEINDFGKMINDTFSKYQKEEVNSPTITYENNSRRAAFGVDSLASIGGGGNVYTGLSVLDVNKQQLKQLQEINSKLGGRDSAFVNSGGDLQPTGISRAQTSAPFTDY